MVHLVLLDRRFCTFSLSHQHVIQKFFCPFNVTKNFNNLQRVSVKVRTPRPISQFGSYGRFRFSVLNLMPHFLFLQYYATSQEKVFPMGKQERACNHLHNNIQATCWITN